MDEKLLLLKTQSGEDSTTQFKRNINNDIQLSEELVAFSNSDGGDLIIGVDDNGSIYKPYCTKDGKYIIKSGADKRKISQEELQRLFQESNKIYADESIVHGTAYKDINIEKFKEYYKKVYEEDLEDAEIEKEKIIENLTLGENGSLTLAGLLLFSKKPQLRRPAFMIKAISFLGNDAADIEYRDSEDISGNLDDQYKNGLSFLTRNLRKIQRNQGFNSEGELEIPKIVLEELLVNALIHRDYFIDSPIKIFIFDNRIEIISPGKLPNTLNIEKIKSGISIMRNPILTSIGSKILPYRGVGTGIRRALKFYNKIHFVNDIDGEIFKAVIDREIN